MPKDYDLHWTCHECGEPIEGAVRIVDGFIYHGECVGAEGVDGE